MADRLSGAASGTVDSSTTAVAEPPVSTPVADPTPEPATEAAPPAEPADTTADVQFEDDPELVFDDEPTAPPAPPEPAQPQDDANSVAELAKVLNAGQLDKRVEDALMKTNRGRHLLSTYKTMRDLRNAPEIDPTTGQNTGGLGFIPSAEQIREFHKAHSDMQAMEHEFAANPTNFVTNWFGPDSNGQFREGVAQTMAAIPSMLDQVYQQASETGNEQLKKQAVDLYAATFRPMLSSYLDGLYGRARSLPEGPDKQAFVNAARAIENDVFGKFRQDAELAPPKPEDAFKAREQELVDRENKLKSWEMRNQSEAATRARTETFSKIDATLTADIEKAFAASNLKAGMKPFAYQAALKAYKDQIMADVKRNAFAWRQYNFALSKVGTTRGADASTEAIKVYRQAAQTAIRNSYRNVIRDLVDDSVTQNQAAHQSAASSAARTALAAGGQPSPQSVVPQKLQRLSGEDETDYRARRLRTVAGVAS